MPATTVRVHSSAADNARSPDSAWAAQWSIKAGRGRAVALRRPDAARQGCGELLPWQSVGRRPPAGRPAAVTHSGRLRVPGASRSRRWRRGRLFVTPMVADWLAHAEGAPAGRACWIDVEWPVDDQQVQGGWWWPDGFAVRHRKSAPSLRVPTRGLGQPGEVPATRSSLGDSSQKSGVLKSIR